jgi:aminoglycoside N3'-acetyltransferase
VINPFCESIQSEVNKAKSTSLLVHSDVFRARAAISPISDLGKILDQHIQALEFIANGKPLFFPSFNYDFTRSKVYQPQSDPSQLGPLTEFARTHWADRRYGPPIFNFIGKNQNSIEIPETGDVDPFSDKSLFGILHQQSGNVLMYGADFSSFTALHYIERLAGGPVYRYDKVFSGIVRTDQDGDQSVNLIYHCRPMNKTLEYDWKKIRVVAEHEDIITVIKSVSGGEALLINFVSLCDFLCDKLKNDPLYLLNSESIAWVKPLMDKLDRRFIISDFE